MTFWRFTGFSLIISNLEYVIWHVIWFLNVEDTDFAFHFLCEVGNSLSQLYNPQLSSLVWSSSVFFFHLQHNQGGEWIKYKCSIRLIVCICKAVQYIFKLNGYWIEECGIFLRTWEKKSGSVLISYHPWTRVRCCDCQFFFPPSHNFLCKQSKAVNFEYLVASLFKIENQSLRKHFSGCILGYIISTVLLFEAHELWVNAFDSFHGFCEVTRVL